MASANGIDGDLSQCVRCAATRRLKAEASEAHIAAILIAQHWTIIARNYRWIGTELDIIARKETTLLVVEVKFRSKPQNHLSDFDTLIPRKKLAALRRGLAAAHSHYRKETFGILQSRIDLAIVTPAEKNKTPPDKLSEGVDRSTNNSFKVHWYPGIGS